MDTLPPNGLTDTQTNMLGLYYADGMTENEIAEHLGVCQQNVNRKLRKARDRLKMLGLPLPKRFRADTRHVRQLDSGLVATI